MLHGNQRVRYLSRHLDPTESPRRWCHVAHVAMLYMRTVFRSDWSHRVISVLSSPPPPARPSHTWSSSLALVIEVGDLSVLPRRLAAQEAPLPLPNEQTRGAAARVSPCRRLPLREPAPLHRRPGVQRLSRLVHALPFTPEDTVFRITSGLFFLEC